MSAAQIPLAIVGLSGRYPGGATSPDRLWDLLQAGTDAIGEAKGDRITLYFQTGRCYDRSESRGCRLFLKPESIVSAVLLFAALSAAQTAGEQFNDAFDAALEAESNKNYDAAIQQLEKAAGIDPSRDVIWSHLGDVYGFRSSKLAGDVNQADLAKADLAYRNAIRLNPYNAPYHENHALILAKEKKLDDAQEEANKAASMDPAFAAKYYFDFGAVLLTTGQNDAALEAFQKSKANGYIEANYQYGLALVSRMTMTPDGRINLAPGTVEAFQEYLRLAPDGPNAKTACDILERLDAAPKPPC